MSILDDLETPGGTPLSPQHAQPSLSKTGSVLDQLEQPAPVAKSGASPEAPPLPDWLTQSVTDVPSEVEKSVKGSIAGMGGLSPWGKGHKGAIEGTLETGKGLLSAAGAIPSALAAPFRSLIGHPMAAAEHAVGEQIAPKIAAKDDPREMYEKAAEGVDTALSAMRPKGFSPRGAIPQTIKQQPIHMTTNQQFETADNLYDVARQSGVMIKPTAVSQKVANLTGDLHSEGLYNIRGSAPGTHDFLKAWSEQVNASGMSDIGITHSIMKGLKGLLNSPNGNERAAASMALHDINEFLMNLPKRPNDIAFGHANAQQATDALKNATEMWHHASKSQTIEDVVRRGLDRAATGGSGANKENTLKQELRKILDNKRQRAYFNKDELDNIRAMTRDDYQGNIIRLLGKLAPTGVVSATLGLEMGRLLFGDATAFRKIMNVLPAIVGHAARKIGETRTRVKIEDLAREIRLRPTQGSRTVTPSRPSILNPGYLAPLINRNRKEEPEKLNEFYGGSGEP